jgi:hypothetical protein
MPMKPVRGMAYMTAFKMKRINHQEAYSLDGACANYAEEYFSRLRRAEIGIHHHIAGSYLLRYAQESSWREDNRRCVRLHQEASKGPQHYRARGEGGSGNAVAPISHTMTHQSRQSRYTPRLSAGRL